MTECPYEPCIAVNVHGVVPEPGILSEQGQLDGSGLGASANSMAKRSGKSHEGRTDGTESSKTGTNNMLMLHQQFFNCAIIS